MQRPLLICPCHSSYKRSTLVAALGALHALYMVRYMQTLICAHIIYTVLSDWMLRAVCTCVPQPLEVREASLKPSPYKVCVLGLWVAQQAQGQILLDLASALEGGR